MGTEAILEHEGEAAGWVTFPFLLQIRNTVLLLR